LVLKTSGIIHFQRIIVDEKLVSTRVPGKSVDDLFAKSFRLFNLAPKGDCEDGFLTDLQCLEALRLIDEEDEESGNSESSFSL